MKLIKYADPAEYPGIIDSTVIIDHFQNYKKASDWILELPENHKIISLVTYAELIEGCDDRTSQQKVSVFFNGFKKLPINEGISESAIDWFEKMKLSHNTSFMDCLIGATAYAFKLPLYTHNMKHFKPMPITVIIPY